MSSTPHRIGEGRIRAELEIDASKGPDHLRKGRKDEAGPGKEEQKEILKYDIDLGTCVAKEGAVVIQFLEAGQSVVAPCRCVLVRLHGVVKSTSANGEKGEGESEGRMETGESGSDVIVVDSSEDGGGD